MSKEIDWNEVLKPLIKKYEKRKHPLDYKNIYELVVMVILSAQDSDKHINELSTKLFGAFGDIKSLAKADEEMLHKYIGKVRNFGNKTKWLIDLARQIKEDNKIPLTMKELTALPGIGRKSANVIQREMKRKAEGIVVDLHVLRVAPRLGVVKNGDAKKMEKELMEVIDEKDWGEIGMAMSFLGREICRPTNAKHQNCVMKDVCAFYKNEG